MKKRVTPASKQGFSLIEILVVMGIIGILATIAIVALVPIRSRARDTKRKSDLSQIGRFFSLSCYSPQTGDGAYDLYQILDDLIRQNPQYAQYAPSKSNLRDPQSGTDSESNYKYIIDNGKCVLYANLENDGEKVTLPSIFEPTPGGGKGVFQSSSSGWNGSTKYFQVSN